MRQYERDESDGLVNGDNDASYHHQGIPFNTLHDIPGMYYGYQRIYELVEKPELIIPGHDPLVQDCLTRMADGILSLS